MVDEAKAAKLALAVVKKQSAQRESLALALLKALLGLWGGFNGWSERDLVTGQAARSAILVEATLAKHRRQTRSYASTMLRAIDALPNRELDAVQDLYPRSGVAAAEVYTRPAEQYLFERSQGVSDAEARKHVAQRLEKLARMDMQLTARDETGVVYAASPKVIGRRRIIHPELSSTGFSCGLCVVIADRIYSVSKLEAVHDGCNCTEGPITAGFDPGLQLNRDDLDKFYELAGSTAADDLRTVSVRIDEHGELGPILRNADHSFRGPADASTSRHRFTPFEPMTPQKQRAELQRVLGNSQRAVERLKKALADGDDEVILGSGGQEQSVTDFQTALKFHEDLISRYLARL